MDETSSRPETKVARQYLTLASEVRRIGLLLPLLSFAQSASTALAGLLIVARALDLLGQTLFLTHLLKTSEHLIEGFIASGFDLDHASECPFSEKPANSSVTIVTLDEKIMQYNVRAHGCK